ncbi:MAG: DUF2752 domain-containing protein [Lachnospiraceae bacterium]|nr:DUF2752 domain-containing protein [Lachnospiraceae bacterium]
MVAAHLLTGTSCAIKSTIGVPCPGCGLVRSYLSLLTSGWREAFSYHPLFAYLPLFILVWIVKRYRHGSENPRWFILFARGSLVLLMAVFAVRMILFFPHTAPMDFNDKTPVARLINLIMT